MSPFAFLQFDIRFTRIVQFATVLVFILIPILEGHAKTISGKVVHVSDGDTIRIKDWRGKDKEIRFYGIDTPELAQSFGRAAKEYTSRAVYKKKVDVEVYDVDRYGRTVGVVLAGKNNVNMSLIEQGLAWHYGQYCKKSFCDDWKELEREAKGNQRGLWADKDATPPWEWRKKERERNGQIDILRKIERILKWCLRLFNKIERILDLL